MNIKFKTLISASILLLSITNVFSYNPSTLDNFSNTFNEYIWSERPISVSFIENSLYFLEDDDKEIIKKYESKNMDDLRKKIISFEDAFDKNSHKNLMNFFNNCKEIYITYQDFYQIPQIAVQILFEKVLSKYQEHEINLKEDNSIYNLAKNSLVLKRNAIDQNFHSPQCKIRKGTNEQTSASLLEENSLSTLAH